MVGSIDNNNGSGNTERPDDKEGHGIEVAPANISLFGEIMMNTLHTIWGQPMEVDEAGEDVGGDINDTTPIPKGKPIAYHIICR